MSGSLLLRDGLVPVMPHGCRPARIRWQRMRHRGTLRRGTGPGSTIAFPRHPRKIGAVSAKSPRGRSRVGRPVKPERHPRATALLALIGLLTWTAGGAQEPVAAVWKERAISFTYRSSIAVYSCNALRARVASILRAVGARNDIEIRLANCDESMVVPSTVVPSANAPDRTISRPVYGSNSILDRRDEREQSVDIRVVLFMPVEMTPDVLSELKADKSRRELITRVTGNPLPKFDDPIPFAAQRRVVTLSHETVGLEPAECELLDQLSRSAFPALDVQVHDRNYTCDRRRVSRIRPTLAVQALVPTFLEDGESTPPAATGGGDTHEAAPEDSSEEPAPTGHDPPPE